MADTVYYTTVNNANGNYWSYNNMPAFVTTTTTVNTPSSEDTRMSITDVERNLCNLSAIINDYSIVADTNHRTLDTRINYLEGKITCLEGEIGQLRATNENLRKSLLRLTTQVNKLIADKQVQDFNAKNN